MSEKMIKSRFALTHDIEANWKSIGQDFIPKAGEIIVYDIDNNYDYERMKIGDGIKNLNSLPFALENEKLKLLSNNLSDNGSWITEIQVGGNRLENNTEISGLTTQHLYVADPDGYTYYRKAHISANLYPNQYIYNFPSANGTFALKETINEVPACSTSDNGKFLRVVNGVAAWATVPNAEDSTF